MPVSFAWGFDCPGCHLSDYGFSTELEAQHAEEGHLEKFPGCREASGEDWEAVKARLASARTVPDGCELVAVVDEEWRLVAGKKCARKVRDHASCQEPAVAELNRGHSRWSSALGRLRRFDSWWPYCAAHLTDYGHWIEDGKVMSWILRDIPAGGTRGD